MRGCRLLRAEVLSNPRTHSPRGNWKVFGENLAALPPGSGTPPGETGL